MKNFLNKFKYFILGGVVVLGGTVFAAQITVPNAPSVGYMLQGLSTGQWIASSTQTAYFGNYIATSTRLNIFPYASTTAFSTGYASSTDLRVGTFTFGGVTGSTWASFCTSITGSSDLCDGSDASGGGSGSGNVATSTNETNGQIPYWTTTSGTPAKLGSVATSTCPTFSTGLSYSGVAANCIGGTNGNVTVNTTQNIIALSNLTSNGLVYTAGSNGTLNVVATSTATCSSGITCNTFTVVGSTNPSFTNSGVTSIVAGSGISISGATGAVTVTNSNEKWATSTDGYTIYPTGQMGIFGTTTSRIFPLTIASSTVPQLSLGDGVAGDAQWTFRNATGNLYFSTTTVQGLATTSSAAFSILSTGEVIARNLFQIINTAGTKIMDVVGNAVTLLGAWDFGGATSVEIPNGTSPTVDATGEIAVDTTSDQLIYFGGTAKKVISPVRDLGFAYATTTWNATTTIRIGPSPAAITISDAYCETNAGTVGVSLYDGTNRATYIPTASSTINKFTYSASNNSFTAGESIRVDMGTPVSSPTLLSCRFLYTYDAD